MTIDEQAATLTEAACSFHGRMARHRGFRERFGRRLSADKRQDILAAAEALETVAADLRVIATTAPADPLRALIAQARELGVVL